MMFETYKKEIKWGKKNIIIENELITNNKYIADIKINFDKKQIINFLRNNKINYTDIVSKNFLIVSTFDEKFTKSGLTTENIFYQNYDIHLYIYSTLNLLKSFFYFYRYESWILIVNNALQ